MIFETKQQVKPEAKINGKYGMTKLNKDLKTFELVVIPTDGTYLS